MCVSVQLQSLISMLRNVQSNIQNISILFYQIVKIISTFAQSISSRRYTLSLESSNFRQFMLKFEVQGYPAKTVAIIKLNRIIVSEAKP